MVRRNTTISIEDNLIKLAKLKGLNVSKFIEESLKNYLNVENATEINKDDRDVLKEQIMKKTAELTSLRNKMDQIELKREKERSERDKSVIKEIEINK
jgi:hypothetical protein